MAKRKEPRLPDLDIINESFRIGDKLSDNHGQKLEVIGFDTASIRYGADPRYFDSINQCLLLKIAEGGSEKTRRAWILRNWNIDERGTGREVRLLPGETDFCNAIKGHTKKTVFTKTEVRVEPKIEIKQPPEEEQTGQLSLF